MSKPLTNNFSEQAFLSLAHGDFKDAVTKFRRYLQQHPDDSNAVIGLARGYLGLGQNHQAEHTYQHLIQFGAEQREASAYVEALIYFGKFDQAAKHANDQSEPRDPELLFLKALTNYIRGHIIDCVDSMNSATTITEIWQEHDAKDPLIHHLLSAVEYQDLEHIFLDAQERAENESSHPQNRWFSICVPSYELFNAKTKSDRDRRITELEQVLVPHRTDTSTLNGKMFLGQLLDDLTKEGVKSEFANPSKEMLENGNLQRLAEHILGFELDHLQHFSQYFGLTDQFIIDSSLRDLIEVMPYRIAVGLAFLYMVANPLQGIGGKHVPQMDSNTLARLIASSFMGFYQQTDHFRQLNN